MAVYASLPVTEAAVVAAGMLMGEDAKGSLDMGVDGEKVRDCEKRLCFSDRSVSGVGCSLPNLHDPKGAISR